MKNNTIHIKKEFLAKIYQIKEQQVQFDTKRNAILNDNKTAFLFTKEEAIKEVKKQLQYYFPIYGDDYNFDDYDLVIQHSSKLSAMSHSDARAKLKEVDFSYQEPSKIAKEIVDIIDSDKWDIFVEELVAKNDHSHYLNTSLHYQQHAVTYKNVDFLFFENINFSMKRNIKLEEALSAKVDSEVITIVTGKLKGKKLRECCLSNQ